MRILRASTGWAPSESTLLRHFHRLELMGPAAGAGGGLRPVRGRHTERAVGRRRPARAEGRRPESVLFAFLDDHSPAGGRLPVRVRRGHRAPGRSAGTRARRPRRPGPGYVDNGAMFIDSGLRRACADLGIRLVTHSRPGMPAGRGKIERFFKTVRDQFLVEISDDPNDPSRAGTIVGSLAASSTACSPRGSSRSTIGVSTPRPSSRRWCGSWPPARRSPLATDLLSEAFRWGQVAHRHQDRDGQPAGQPLRGRSGPGRVPRSSWSSTRSTSTDIDVRHHGRPVGKAVPFRIGKHVHPQGPRRRPTPAGTDRDRLPAPGRRPAHPRSGPAAAVRAPVEPNPAGQHCLGPARRSASRHRWAGLRHRPARPGPHQRAPARPGSGAGSGQLAGFAALLQAQQADHPEPGHPEESR